MWKAFKGLSCSVHDAPRHGVEVTSHAPTITKRDFFLLADRIMDDGGWPRVR